MITGDTEQKTVIKYRYFSYMVRRRLVRDPFLPAPPSLSRYFIEKNSQVGKHPFAQCLNPEVRVGLERPNPAE
jgi:hypothetical protein